MTIQNITPILANLYDFWTERQIARWLTTPNDELDGQTPEAAIAAGEFDRVLERARMLNRLFNYLLTLGSVPASAAPDDGNRS